MLKFSELHEALAVSDVNTTPGTEEVDVLLGRFQPLTAAHEEIIEKAHKQNRRKVIVAVVKSGNEKSPFPFKLVKEIIEKSIKAPIEVIELSSGFIGDFISPLRDKGMEPIVLFAGSDRLKGYEGQIKRYKDIFAQNLRVQEIPRTDADVSASKVRDALAMDDEALFQSMTPKGSHKYFNKLKGLL